MPVEIQHLMDSMGSRVKHNDSHKKRLREHLPLFDPIRYRLDPAGNVLVDPERTTTGNTDGANGGSGSGPGKRDGGHGGGGGGTRTRQGTTLPAGGASHLFQKPEGDPAIQIRGEIPEVEWVSLAEGTRGEGEMDDRAGQYISVRNSIKANTDFRYFQDVFKRFETEFCGQPALESTVKQSVQSWMGQALCEAVMGIMAFRDLAQWPLASINEALSETALTTAVLAATTHVHNRVRNELTAKFGSARQRASVSTNGEAHSPEAPAL